jgi:hypothetical protein
MFALLDGIKNTLFSFSPLPSTAVQPMNTIASISNDDDEAESITETIIDRPEPIIAEPEQVNVFDKRPYVVSNLVSGEPEEYHYLHGDNLAQSYDVCLNKSTATVVVHICMVGMDFQCSYSGERLPFLRFLMEYGPSTIDFPKCQIMCHTIDYDNDGESKMDEMDTYFHNECKKRVVDFFVIEGQTPMASPLEFPHIPENVVRRNTSQLSKKGDFGELLNKSYRGYKEIGDGELVVVFDITDFLNIPLRKSRNPGWMVLDDFEDQVLSISPKVLQFFGENKYMREIRDPLNNLVETPKSMYLYDPVYSRFMMKAEKSEWLEPRSFHPSYGNFYYLNSLNNVSMSENPQILESYRKCVVFLKNYADLLENTSIELSGINITESKETKENISSVGEENDLELSDDEDESELYNYAGEYDKTEIQNNLPFVSLIMFSEKGEQIYCVKTESIFAEL